MSNDLSVEYHNQIVVVDELGNRVPMYQATFNGQTILFDENHRPWMSQADIAEMFSIDRGNLVKTLNRIEDDGILSESNAVRITTVARDGKKRAVNYYNLEIINVVGCRIYDVTPKVLAFIRWAGAVLNNHVSESFEAQLAELQNQVESLSDALTESEKAAKATAHWDRFHYERNRKLVADLRHGVIPIDNWEA